MTRDEQTRVPAWLEDTFVGLHQDPEFVTDQVAQDVALQIAEAMEEAGFETQKSFAKHLGVSRAAVSQLLSGKENLSLKRLVKVALALGKTVKPPQIVEYTPPNVKVVSDRSHSKQVDLDGFAQTRPALPSRPTQLSASQLRVDGQPLDDDASSDLTEEERASGFAFA